MKLRSARTKMLWERMKKPKIKNLFMHYKKILVVIAVDVEHTTRVKNFPFKFIFAVDLLIFILTFNWNKKKSYLIPTKSSAILDGNSKSWEEPVV